MELVIRGHARLGPLLKLAEAHVGENMPEDQAIVLRLAKLEEAAYSGRMVDWLSSEYGAPLHYDRLIQDLRQIRNPEEDPVLRRVIFLRDCHSSIKDRSIDATTAALWRHMQHPVWLFGVLLYVGSVTSTVLAEEQLLKVGKQQMKELIKDHTPAWNAMLANDAYKELEAGLWDEKTVAEWLMDNVLRAPR